MTKEDAMSSTYDFPGRELQSPDVAQSLLETLVREYARDLRKSSSGEDDLPATADYLETLIERAHTGDVAQSAQVTDAMVERAWAAIVGSDVAPICFQASIIRADLKIGLEAALAAQPPAAPVETAKPNKRARCLEIQRGFHPAEEPTCGWPECGCDETEAHNGSSAGNEHGLLPCPFCGGGADFYDNHVDFERKWSVSCGDCGANLDVCEDTKTEAAARWNARHRDVPQTSAVGLTNLAETIHNARWPEGKDARSFIPFQEEDLSGQDYCTRIARAIMSEYSLSRPPL